MIKSVMLVNSVRREILFTSFFLLLNRGACGQVPSSVIDLDRVANLLDFPRSELVITDYLDQEKFIYFKQNTSEENSGRIPPVNPESIYRSYLITSKTPDVFLPIIITLSKPDAYLTARVKEIISGINLYASQQRLKGNDFAYGDFKLLGASHASLFSEEIRVPAHSNRIIQPGDTWTRPDEYPKNHPAIVSIVGDESGEVDVRIAQYTCLYYPAELVKIPGGQGYFSIYNDDPEDDPKETPIRGIFKGLNEIVLTSPIMEPYRKSSVTPVGPTIPKDESVKALPVPTVPQNPAKQSPAVEGDISKSSPQIWLYLLLLLGCGGVVVAWLRKRGR